MPLPGLLAPVPAGALARVLAALLAAVLAAGAARADNADCLLCHADPTNFSDRGARATLLVVSDDSLATSAHRGFACVDCHAALAGVQDFPHAELVPLVDCGSCHAEEAGVYQWHGTLRVGEGEDIPRCSDCHGTHDIRPAADKGSLVNPLHLPQTCGRCHEDLDLVTKHHIPVDKPVEVFQSSIHGRATRGGIYSAASCNDCHSSRGTAHAILAPGNPESAVNHFNIPRTCGRCHQNIAQDYAEGVHGQLTARGETDAPVCTDCHGEHGILSPDDPRSPVSPARVAEATCSPCHESARLNEKYGIPTGRLRSWVDSYHGLKSRAGDYTVANCASCHGGHRILPHTDATSSINPANLRRTCGECHPGITAATAQVPVHGAPGVTRTAAARVVRSIYRVVISLTIGIMALYVLVDLRRQLARVGREPQARRMGLGAVWQHMLLAVSFTVLVITGFALRFSEAWWVQWLFGWEGGFPLRGTIHRVAAVVFMATVVWHLVFLATRPGRRFFHDMKPRGADFGQFAQMILHNLGRRAEGPRFGRFSFIEKAEYWALVWGTVVMVASGLAMWAERVTVRYFPKGFLDVMLIVHYYEAWLAFLAILIWHLYSTVFSPSVYPMNPSWITGKMPLEVLRHEHPEDPALREETGPASSR